MKGYGILQSFLHDRVRWRMRCSRWTQEWTSTTSLRTGGPVPLPFRPVTKAAFWITPWRACPKPFNQFCALCWPLWLGFSLAMAEPAQKKARTTRTFLFSSESVNEGLALSRGWGIAVLSQRNDRRAPPCACARRPPGQDLRPGLRCRPGRVPEGRPQEQGGLRDGDQGLQGKP